MTPQTGLRGRASNWTVRALLASFIALPFAGAGSPVVAADGSGSPIVPDKATDGAIPHFPTEFAKESDKGPVIQYYARTLTNLSYPYLKSPSTVPMPQDTIDYCQKMGEDLRALNGVTFVEPIAKGKTIDDPAVRAHWAQCKKLDPDYVAFNDATIPLYYWNGSATLYQVNYQNGAAANQELRLDYPAGREPLLLFSDKLCARNPKPTDEKCIGQIFRAVDPSDCTMPEQTVISGGQIWVDDFKYNLSTVIRYKGLVWLVGISDNFAHERFFGAAANGPLHPVHICSFTEPRPN